MIAAVLVLTLPGECGAAAAHAGKEDRVVYGDERSDVYLPLLEGKRVALFSNQSGIVGNRVISTSAEAESSGDSASRSASAGRQKAGGEADAGSDSRQEEGLVPFGMNADGSPAEYGEHILEALVRQGVDVTVAFSPEHGFRGSEDAGAQVGDYTDEKTGVPVVSLYRSGSGYPSGQDVGLRFYTYYISMYYLMDACAEAGKEVVILDRPNPNGFYVDGPLLQDGFYSGVGMLPIPVVHGMTLGELASRTCGRSISILPPACLKIRPVPWDGERHIPLSASAVPGCRARRDMTSLLYLKIWRGHTLRPSRGRPVTEKT